MRRFIEGLLDLVFPPRCSFCGAGINGGLSCDKCLGDVHFISRPLCPQCGLPHGVEGAPDHLCGDCIRAGEAPYSQARSMAVYSGPVLELVHRFKYAGKRPSGEALGKMMVARAGGLFEMANFDMLVPVPLHRDRLKQRGFNQSLVLAREIARSYGLPVDFESLRRVRDTGPQAALGGADRLGNVKGAFAAAAPVRGRRILLVDDVFTTGSTVWECARVLAGQGAREVAVYTAARAVRN